MGERGELDKEFMILVWFILSLEVGGDNCLRRGFCLKARDVTALTLKSSR